MKVWCADCGRDKADIGQADAPDWLIRIPIKGQGEAIRCLPCSRAQVCTGCNRHSIADKTPIIQRDGVALCSTCAPVLAPVG